MDKSQVRPSDWIDISVPLHDGMVYWPADPPVRIKRVLDVERGDGHTLSEISMGSHTGTHMDAPSHFIKGGQGIDRMPLAAAVGRARIVEIKATDTIGPDELMPHRIQPGERILFKTRNSARLWQTDEFSQEFVYLSNAGADYLAACRVSVVGVDYLSVGGYHKGGSYPHNTLLQAGVWIIEGLDLSQVGPGEYDLICLPLRLQDGDGAPARAIIRPLKPGL